MHLFTWLGLARYSTRAFILNAGCKFAVAATSVAPAAAAKEEEKKEEPVEESDDDMAFGLFDVIIDEAVLDFRCCIFCCFSYSC